MTMFRMQSNFLIGLFMIMVLSSLGNAFSGIVVAKLPFEPIFLFKSMTHRGILGNDFTDCSYLPIYILTSYICRQNI